MSQVDDFHKLIEQLKGPIASELLAKVDFRDLVHKILALVHRAVTLEEMAGDKDMRRLVETALDLLLPCVIAKSDELVPVLYDYKDFEGLLVRTLMFSGSETIRKTMEHTFRVICTHVRQSEVEEYKKVEHPKLYLLNILLRNLPDNNTKSDRCEEYFNLLTNLIRICSSYFYYYDPYERLWRGGKGDEEAKQARDDEGFFCANKLLDVCVSNIRSR